jgi:RNA polymerase sigma-70 factor (ECF subfamily)
MLPVLAGVAGVFTRTTTQILESLRDPANAGLWQMFDDRYRPVVFAFARRQGLSEEEAGEVAQVTLAQFTADYRAGRYQRDKGRLSSWIIGIARNRVIDAGRAKARRRGERGESALVEVPDQAAAESDWREARQKVILERAMDVLRSETKMDERTIRAFDLCAIRNVPAETAAAECGMTVNEVYVAKNRAIKKLREIVAAFTQEFDDE